MDKRAARPVTPAWYSSTLHGGTDLVVRLAPLLAALSVGLLMAAFADVDPARGVTTSTSPFTDESWNLIDSRNLVVFGRFTMDEWATYLLSLPFSVAEAAVFAVFGIGIVQARLVDIACVSATVWLLAAGLRPWFGTAGAVLGGLAYGCSALVLFYGRLAFLEPMAAMFLTAGVLCAARATGTRPLRWGTAAGTCFALAAGCKLTAFAPVAAVLFVVAIVAVRDRSARRWLGASCVTLAALAAAWVMLFVLPNAQSFHDVVTRIYPPGSPTISPGILLRRLVGYVTDRGDSIVRPGLPLIMGGVVGAGAVALTRRLLMPAPLLLATCAAAWFVATLLALVELGLQANRYFVIALPALAILTAAATSVALARPRRLQGRVAHFAAACGLAVALTLPGLVSYAGWMVHGSRDAPAAQDLASRLVPADSVVAGRYAALVAMRTRARIVVTCCGRNPVNAGDQYVLTGARFWADPYAPAWAGEHPDAWARREQLLCFTWHVPPVPVCLSRLP